MASRHVEIAKQRFGPFEFDPANGELRKNGIRIRLQTKPAQMLTALLATPGQVVAREELRQRLWPDDTFVDFESGLNSAVKRLRDALCDSADEPKYIETLPRNGYRFVGVAEPLTVAPPPALGDMESMHAPAPRRPPYGWIASAAAAGVVVGLIPWLASTLPTAAPPRFRQITFQRSPVASARFAPDGQTIVYSAHSPAGRKVFVNNGVSPESRMLENRSGVVVSVSHRGELALLAPRGTTPLAGSVLSIVPMNGGDPRELDHSVMSADWSPEGELAIARAAGGAYQLEYPRGKVLFQTSGWLSHVRVSPTGDRVAFLHHPVRHDDGGSLNVVDAAGALRILVKDWAAVSGLAWHPATGEIWFSGVREGGAKSLWAVNMSSRLRGVLNAPGSVSIADIAPGGSVLLSRDVQRLEMAVGGDGRAVSEITWYDWSRIQEISADGSLILFEESGDGAAGRPVTFLFRADNSSAVRVGEGRAMGIAPDGQRVLLIDAKDRTRLFMAPLGPGAPVPLPSAGLDYQWARFLPGGQSLLALASERGGPLRIYRVDIAGRKAAPLTPPTVVRNAAVSPDGGSVAILNAEGRLMIYPLSGDGEPRTVPVTEPMAPLLWTNEALIAQRASSYTEVPARLFHVNIKSGASIPWRDIGPLDTTGVNAITRVLVTPDLKHWAFNYRRVQSEIFLATGLR